MSSAALGPYARASALASKSRELMYRGHTERADDKLRDALAAARAVGSEDCLVTAFLTVEVTQGDLSSLLRLTHERLMAPLDRLSFAAKLREFAVAATGAAAVARRRRAAGTPQPAERAWYEEFYVADSMCAQGFSSESEALAHTMRLASICSETIVYAAYTTLDVLRVATRSASFSASELTSRLAVTCDLIDEAVALAGLQRVEGTSSCYEWGMKKRLQRGIDLWRQQSSTAVHAARLTEALKQLCFHCGVSADQEAREDQEAKVLVAKVVAAQSAATAPELLRSCALASCGAKEAHVKHFSRCAACKAVVYCSKTCQLADWPAHKKACKAARKAAEAAKTSSAGNAA